MGHKCEFPNCGNMSIRHDSFFGKFHCEKHDFHLVVWPKELTTLDTVPFPVKPKKPGGKQFGKNYFKKDKKC